VSLVASRAFSTRRTVASMIGRELAGRNFPAICGATLCAVRRKVCDVDACRVFVVDQGLVMQGRQISSGSLNHPDHVGPSPVRLLLKEVGNHLSVTKQRPGYGPVLQVGFRGGRGPDSLPCKSTINDELELTEVSISMFSV
jgi:hypothetical protein